MSTTTPSPARSTFLLVAPNAGNALTGHLMNLLDVAWELSRRGHRVLVHTPESARALVEAAGAEWVSTQGFKEVGVRTDEVAKSAPRWARSGLLGGLYNGWHLRRILDESAADLATRLEPVLRGEQVDCLVYDFFALGASYAAERVGIPAVSTGNLGNAVTTRGFPLALVMAGRGWKQRLHRLPSWLGHGLVDAVVPLRKTRARLGLPPRPVKHAELFQVMASPQLNLIPSQPGCLAGVPLREQQLFTGPNVFDGAPAPAEAPPTIEPGTVLVSTTTVGRDRGLLRKALEALEPMGCPVLATTAGARDVPTKLGPHIRTEQCVPHEQVLPHVSALVTHGGWGAVSRALRHGVPMLIIPLFADQPLNAKLLEQQGLAYQLPLHRATPEAIRERVQSLLKDQALRERLKKTAEELRALRQDNPAIEALERLARETRERRTPGRSRGYAPESTRISRRPSLRDTCPS